MNQTLRARPVSITGIVLAGTIFHAACGRTTGFDNDDRCDACAVADAHAATGGTRGSTGGTSGTSAAGSVARGGGMAGTNVTKPPSLDGGSPPDAATNVPEAGRAPECEPGAVRSCACPGREGFAVCHPPGAYGDCVCEATSTDDGTGADGGDARDGGVTNTPLGRGDPFVGGVYFQGTTAEGSCDADALQRFWPTLSDSYYTGFDCYADHYTFRPTDGAVFYLATFKGLFHDGPGNSDDLVPTPPCSEYVKERIGFDEKGTLHYVCSESLMREGANVAEYVDQLAAVLADGRAVITTTHPDGFGTDYIVLDRNGKELSRLRADELSTGTVKLAPSAATVAGNRAYVGVLHTLRAGTREIVAYRVNESNRWQLLRRAAVDTFGDVQLVISDGTVFVRDKDPNGNAEPRIRAFLVDGTVHVAWREGAARGVREHIGNELLVGPTVPNVAVSSSR